MPALAAIISELEILCDEHEDDNSKTPRRFPLMPTPSMGWRYISINAKALQYITKHKSNGTYKDNVSLFIRFLTSRSLATKAWTKFLKAKTSLPVALKQMVLVHALPLQERQKKKNDNTTGFGRLF